MLPNMMGFSSGLDASIQIAGRSPGRLALNLRGPEASLGIGRGWFLADTIHNKVATPLVVGPVDIDRLSLPGALCRRYYGTAPDRDPVDIGLRSRPLASTIDRAVWLPGRMIAGPPCHLKFNTNRRDVQV